MNITCPKCKTVYRLPEENRKKKAKFRCSVCRYVFLAEEGIKQPAANPENADLPHLDFNAEQPAENQEPVLNFDDYVESEKSPQYKENADKSLCPPIFDETQNNYSKKISGDIPPGTTLEMPKKRNYGALHTLFYLFLWCGIFGGSYYLWNYSEYLNFIKPNIAELVNNMKTMCGFTVEKELPKKSAIESIVFAETKQYKIKNKFMGYIIVISGSVRNDADSSRELIKVTGSLTDDQNNVLASETQFAGVVLLKEQLENFNDEEMMKYLQNKYEIMKNNIDLKPGDSSPFTIVFTHVPPTATGFKVEIVDAVIPHKTGNLAE